MFNPTRDEVRQFFCETWRKHRENALMSPLETMALDAILAHPEYHAALEAPDLSETMEQNPFLHLSLHLAVAEQLSINQPFGITERYERLLAIAASRHDALHRVMECLGEMIWQSQRHNTPPDQAIYFECMDRQLSR
ncbi:MAG: DUF1841 family protein [Burkholderiales bacterium]